LSCDAGKKSVESTLTGKRIIIAMNDRGIMNAVTKVKEQNDIPQTLYIDKSTVNITRFTLDT